MYIIMYRAETTQNFVLALSWPNMKAISTFGSWIDLHMYRAIWDTLKNKIGPTISIYNSRVIFNLAPPFSNLTPQSKMALTHA